MQNQLMFFLPLIILFAFLLNFYISIRSINKHLGALAKQFDLIQENLTEMEKVLKTIKKRVGISRQDSIVDEFVEIDSDQWLNQEDHKQLRELKHF
tara:strand:+ start:17643 stop:17930 length:288 start_codon:yes stop_codon:yes gene_type:complete